MTVAEKHALALRLNAVVITLMALGFVIFLLPPDDHIFFHFLERHDYWGAWLMLAVLLLPWRSERFGVDAERLVVALARRRHWVALAVWILLSVGTLTIYQNHPLSMDEYAATFQARAFASGHLAGKVPPELVDWVIPKRFQAHFFAVNHETGAIGSLYWPGFALIVAPFQWLGVPWACNPLIVALSLLLIGRLAFALTGQEAACGWAMLLALASPGFVLNGLSYYSMPAHLLCNLTFAWLLLQPTAKRIFLAGVVGSFALVLHNPFPHTLFAVPWLVWLVARRNGGLRNTLLLAAGYLPLLLILGVGWIATVNTLLQGTPAAAASDAVAGEAWIVRVLAGLLRPFRLPDEAVTVYRVGEMVKLWLWSAPFLLLLAGAAARVGSERGDSPTRLMTLSFLVTVIGYFFVPVSQGHGWGARYLHSAWGVLPVLAALKLRGSQTTTESQLNLAARIVAPVLLSMVAATLLRVAQTGTFVAAHLAQIPSYPGEGRAVVFIRGGFYAKDLVQNAPRLETQPWFFASQGGLKDELFAQRLLPGGCRYASTSHGVTYVQGDGMASLGPDGTLPPCIR